MNPFIEKIIVTVILNLFGRSSCQCLWNKTKYDNCSVVDNYNEYNVYQITIKV